MINNEKRGRYRFLIDWILILGDLTVVNYSFFLFYQVFFPQSSITLHTTDHIIIICLINLTYFLTFRIIPPKIASNIYFFDQIIRRSLAFITLFFILFLAGITLFGLSNPGLSFWLKLYISSAVNYLLWHIVIRGLLKKYRRSGRNFNRVIIIGNETTALPVYNELKSSVYGYKILALFDEIYPQTTNTILSNLHIDTINRLEAYCLKHQIDEIYYTYNNRNSSTIKQILSFSEQNNIKFYFTPELYGYAERKLSIDYLQSVPVLSINPEPLQKRENRILKRVFDLFFSLIILLTVFPIIFILFAPLIRITSKGPVFFKQKRTGHNGKSFVCYKFRSMILNNDSDNLITSRKDRRITPIGNFMRKTSIDELPQFFNVIQGNMSVVGPRPHMLKQTELYSGLIHKFMIRHAVKPGITGWAQISGYRGETSTTDQMEKRFKHDIWYIENWSFILDLKIIAVTIYQIFRGDKHAY